VFELPARESITIKQQAEDGGSRIDGHEWRFSILYHPSSMLEVYFRRATLMIKGKISSTNEIAKMLAEIGWVKKTAALPWLMARARRA
jgi:hypothetical protein